MLLCTAVIHLSLQGVQVGLAWARSTANSPIRAKQKIEICPHHPHGCPRDCMCPKIASAEVSQGKGSGFLREPAFVICTEQGAKGTSPSAPIFLACPILIPGFPTVSTWLSGGAFIIHDFFQEPPQKIPIV